MKRWELARITLDAAEAAYYNNEEEQWMLLFKWAALNYCPSRSDRQKEIQRLWQQRGLLERAKANLNSCIPLVPDNCLNSRLHLVSSARLIMDLIEINKMNMANIKERIPA